MTIFKNAKVVMIQSNQKQQKNQIFKWKTNLNTFWYAKGDMYRPRDLKYNMHIISNEEIKEGDWCYDKIPNDNGILLDCVYQKKKGVQYSDTSTEKKIIATTDFSLNLPHPSDEFIETWISNHIKGNIIEDIMVEYENCGTLDSTYGLIEHIDTSGISFYMGLKIKINDKNNICIKKIKYEWNKEEVEQLIYAFSKFIKFKIEHESYCIGDLQEWIEEKL